MRYAHAQAACSPASAPSTTTGVRAPSHPACRSHGLTAPVAPICSTCPDPVRATVKLRPHTTCDGWWRRQRQWWEAEERGKCHDQRSLRRRDTVLAMGDASAFFWRLDAEGIQAGSLQGLHRRAPSLDDSPPPPRPCCHPPPTHPTPPYPPMNQPFPKDYPLAPAARRPLPQPAPAAAAPPGLRAPGSRGGHRSCPAAAM
jgi:hypothetical protein